MQPFRYSVAMLLATITTLGSIGHHPKTFPPRSANGGGRLPSEQPQPTGALHANGGGLAATRSAIWTVALDHPTATIARDQCLTIATGTDAAYECGDLRVVHALPSTRTRNKVRTPTLVYNSQHAHPFPVVSAEVTLLSNFPTAFWANMILYVNGQAVASAAFPAGYWGSAGTRHVALTFDATNLATGIYPVTLYLFDGSSGASGSGELAVVNRKDSPFGAGWWLSGLEQLLPQPDSSLVWVGGDGSTRHYTDRGIVGNYRKWVAESVTHPDTIAFTGDNYVRYLPGGFVVAFDETGFHTQTIAPLNIYTAFSHDAQGRLSTIQLPATSSQYTFGYDPNGKLSSVTAPDVGAARATTVAISGGAVSTITDPDGQIVSFGYNPAVGFENMISDRTNRRSVRRFFSYNGAHTLTESKIGLSAAAADTIRTTFCAAESEGSSGSNCYPIPIDSGSLRTIVDGPRTDSTDVTLFAIDRFGAPARIVDAHSQTTLLDRADARFPGLVTRVQHPDGFERRAGYDARGNIIADSAMNAAGDGRVAVTRYEWDPTWDAPTRITPPEGDFLEFQYDQLTGNRLFQRDARSASQIDFTYGATGASAFLFASVIYPSASGPRARDSLEYDGAGNLAAVRRAVGTSSEQVTRYINDGIGRLQRTSLDITAGGTQQQRDSTIYDAMDRVVATKSYGFNTPAETLFTASQYDPEGNRTRLERWSYPDIVASPIGHIVTRWGYDVADRVVADTEPDGRVESRQFDLAGNVVSVTTRRGHVLTSTYDALNKLTSRTIPGVTYQDTLAGIAAMDNEPYPRRPNSGTNYVISADVETFAYDPLGRVVTANNGDAQITRTYSPAGFLQTERQRLRDAGSSTFSHDYLLQYTYDLNGRRKAAHLPSQLVPTGTRDSIAYAYDANTGDLSQVTDALGNAFGYAYTLRGEPSSLAFPGSYAQRWSYDAASNLTRDSVLNLGATTGTRIHSATPRATTFVYDRRGKMLRSEDQVGYQDTVVVSYSGLGYLLRSNMSQNGELQGYSVTDRYSTGEQQTYDALGNMASALTVDTLKVGTSVKATKRERFHSYSGGVGRLVSESSGDGNKTYVYDGNGNVEFSMRQPTSQPTPGEDRFSYYAADEHVRAADYRMRQTSDLTPRQWVFEEYRYDALGRRVWVRSYRDCANYEPLSDYPHLECSTSTLRRTVWDGDQEFIEIQVPGDTSQSASVLENDDYLPRLPRDAGNMDPNPYFGRAVYVHGLALDQPIGVTRYNYVDYFFGRPYTDFAPSTISLFWTARGQMSLAACATGSFACQAGGYDMIVDLPAAWFAYDRPKFAKRVFQGTLIHDKQDAAQTLYRRGRVYDPSSGRFTQEDPIGLLGGMNLYGFASGDPVNVIDPFGLCPLDRPLCNWLKATFVAAGTDIGGILGGGSGLLSGPGAVVASPAGAIAGMGIGATAGAAAGELIDRWFFSENSSRRGSGSSESPQYKIPRPGVSGKEGAKDVPSWAQGERPLVGESGKNFARRLLDDKYGIGKWFRGPRSEFNQLQKYGDRNFIDPLKKP